ncbi:MAG: hypothetical protein DIU78_002350 [Pseudomonadota bacterium]
MQPLETPPRFVLVNAANTHGALDFGSAFQVFDTRGAPTSKRVEKADRFRVIVHADSLLVGGFEMRWDGSPGTFSIDLVNPPFAPESAIQVRHAYVIAAYQTGGARTVPYESFQVDVSDFYLPERWKTRLRWTRSHAGLGAAAIHDDGQVAVVTESGQFFRYSLDRKPNTTEPAHTVESKLSFEPYDLSILDSGYAVLSRADSGTVLHRLDPNGKELWRVAIPFEATQPPVDGGKGRVYVAGKGFAAVEDGKLLYAHPGDQQWATAFEDGTVALAIGPELRIIDRDGTIRQSLRTKDGERLTTPPAIASDGTIWVGSETTLYHAR